MKPTRQPLRPGRPRYCCCQPSPCGDGPPDRFDQAPPRGSPSGEAADVPCPSPELVERLRASIPPGRGSGSPMRPASSPRVTGGLRGRLPRRSADRSTWKACNSERLAYALIVSNQSPNRNATETAPSPSHLMSRLRWRSLPAGMIPAGRLGGEAR